MMDLSKVISPTLLLNADIAKANIQRMAERCHSEKITFRPHFKTHQSALVGEWFREAGINAITVSSVRMAVYFQKFGWKDICIAFPYNFREHKLIEELSKKVYLTLTIPGKESALKLASMAMSEMGVMIKIDTGYNRSGVRWEDWIQVSDIINILTKNPNLKVKGLLTHSGDTYKANNKAEIKSIYHKSVERLNSLKVLLNNKELSISVGDTPSASLMTSYGEVNELRPGNFVFYDLMQYNLGVCCFNDIAVVMACPIVDIRPQSETIVIYGGGVHLSKEHIIIGGEVVYGKAVSLNDKGWEDIDPPCYLISLSQEHGIIRLTPELTGRYKIGDLIGVLPVHSCLAADLAGGYLQLNGSKADHMNEKKFTV